MKKKLAEIKASSSRVMTLEYALDIVLRQAEAYHGNILPAWAESAPSSESDDDKFPMNIDNSVEALEMVKDAVLRYIKIQKEFEKLQEILKEKDQLNGASSIVIEDDNVRSES